ncbi:MAG: amino acid adenylation domain-containing protein [Bacteroidaceae bacterium]|nr:amino acid adenylation domain-containing protein [Bacteroidaceae bacterium]
MKTYAPLTKTQYGLYVECVNHQGEVCYNIPYLYTLDGSLDGERLCKAIETVVAAHPTLFTRIEVDEQGDPVQTIDDAERFSLTVESVSDIEAEKARFVQPFSIVGDRLFRIRLLKDASHYYLLQDIHHIISDGTSRKVLLTDIEKAYHGEQLEAEALPLAEVAKAEAAVRETPQFEEDKKWYAENFDCGDTDSPLLGDLEEDGPKEGLLTRTMSVGTDAVDAFCKDNGIFKSTFFTAAYSFLLAKYNNEQEVLFSTIHNGRADKRLAHAVAMLVKTLPVYAKFADDTTVLDFLRAGQDQMTGCRQHEAYAYSDVVNDLGLRPATTFAWHGPLFDSLQFDGKAMTAQRLNNNTIEVPLYVKAYVRDGHYCAEAEYDGGVYSEVLISQFLESYEAVVEGFLAKERLADIAIATPSQMNLLDSFNQNDVDYDRSQTIVSLFRRQAKATPDKTAVVFKDKRFTYAELDDISDRIAGYIAGRGLGLEDIVAVLIPRSEWMAIASLGVIKAGCAFQPLDPTYPKERLNFMMQDTGTRLLIADEELRPIVDEYDGEVLLTKDLLQCAATDSLPAEPKPESLFTLIYTSGSTGVPKGGMSEHRNWVSFCHMHQQFNNITAASKVAAYASYGFDASPMEIFSALTIGAELHIVPEELRLDLIALNDYFEQNAITHGFMTTQVAYQFATSVENHSLQALMTGGEKLSTLTPPKTYSLTNGYGPSETICYVTAYKVTERMKNIPIGPAMQNCRLYIVDPQGHRLPVGAAGELWVAGPQVSRGYLNRPEKTAEVYIPNPFTTEEKYARVYRTGDIVRYLPDGNISFVGRRDGQVKIRGFRVELKEVEAVVREFPGIKDATVQAFDEQGGGKFIAAYVVSDEPIDIEALNSFILDQKPPYMVPAVTMQIDAIPLNQNQKVNKRALPKPEKKAAAVEESDVPMNVLEQELHEMIAAIVGNTDFGITTVLGYAGLTSISAIKLAVQVNKRFGVTLDSKSLVKTGTLQSIENEILSEMLNGQTAAPKEGDTNSCQLESVPLSYAQTGVYFECLKNPTSTIYNIPCLLSYPAGTEADRLADAVRTVAEAHPELSVHFATEGDRIVQTLAGSVPVEVPVTEMTDEALADYKTAFVRPFNLQKPPLYRFEVVKTESGTHLLTDVHHLVFDGGSTDLFIRQIASVLDGAPVEKETYTYFDFVADQQKAEESDTFKSAQHFFAEKLQTCEGASEIPADMPQTDQQGFIAEAVCPTDLDKATAFCRQQNITPAHLYLAATSYVVSRYTNNREVYLSTISSGRSNLRIADTVGMFVNTLALAMKIDDVTVADYLHEVSETFDKTLRHEDYPFARIAGDYGFRPAICYEYQVGVVSEYTVGGKPVGHEVLELNVPKFKISVKILTDGIRVQYDDAAYTAELAQGLADSIAATVEHIIAHPEGKVRKLSIVSAAQEEHLNHIRQTATGDAPFKVFCDCFAHYAQTQPDRMALIGCDARFTYREFDEMTSRIAGALQTLGVQPRDRVALLLPRTSRLILSMFGVQKAGAAYIPCDPEYPADRIKLILEDSEARFIITTADRLDSVPAGKGIDVETLVSSDAALTPVDITPDDLAYLIYTSGSTGRPKGVMLRHEGMCNYATPLPANVEAYAVANAADSILAVTTISFDASLHEIAISLFNGLTLVVANENQTKNPLDMAALIREHHIGYVSATPSQWQTWIYSDDFVEAIRTVPIIRFGGEKLPESLLHQMQQLTPSRILNTYGPTETTVSSNIQELTHAERVTVGRPQLNVKEFVVDSDGNELPVGVVGELYIGGRGVARGYNNLDEMTRERFIDYHGTRIYKSGDYAKWLPDGDVAILGRTDHQIKLRGLRIELGEVENVIARVEGVKNVVIMIRKISGKEHLCAYFTADHPIDIAEMKAEISKSLTQYMVPTAYLQLDKMPMTPNGKTDIKALPDPELAVSSEYEAPQNDAERTFCDIFADILQMDKVGATDNFFDLGGTSLVVTRVIIEADKAGLHVSYGEVFANPTPRKLALLTTGGAAPAGSSDGTPSATPDPVADFDYTAINNLLQRNTLGFFRAGERQQLGNVLITGTTGYLGIHILRELIDSDAGNIYCMVRGKTLAAAESRLRTMLFYYFDSPYEELFGKRLHVVLGDVTNDLCGVLNGYAIDTVFNCAAVVKHFSEGTEIEDVNIGGAQRCVEFCIKTGARLIHISTASTRGLWAGEIKNEIFSEQRLYMGQYLGNQYIYSKFMAERLILDAVALHGLSAKIMRVGNLAARSTDGEFQANFSTNSFMGRIRVYNMLGCCPYGMRNKRVEFSPINEVARAIVLLSATPEECTVFHPYNIHGQFLGDVLSALTVVTGGIRFVEQEEFQQAMDEAGKDPQKAKQMAALLAYKDMAHGKKTTDVQRDNDYTTQVLYRLGFSWSPTSWDYIERMLTAIGGFGFFEY